MNPDENERPIIKTYKIPLNWRVGGLAIVRATNLDEAIKGAELNLGLVDAGIIHGTVEVNYETLALYLDRMTVHS